MESNQAIIWMIILCFLFLFFIVLSKPAKLLFKAIFQGAVGFIGIYLFNFILMPLNLSIGVNFLTVFIIAVLGLPGFVMLYVTNFFI